MQSTDMILNAATIDDSRFIWELANDPLIRAASFSSEDISWEEHQKWYSAKIQDARCLFFVVENAVGEKIGQIRFERKSEGWVISLSIVKEFRGRGLGSKIILSASEHLFNTESSVNKIHAYIKKENLSSIRVFEKANYKKVRNASINSENDAVLMVLKHQ